MVYVDCKEDLGFFNETWSKKVLWSSELMPNIVRPGSKEASTTSIRKIRKHGPHDISTTFNYLAPIWGRTKTSRRWYLFSQSSISVSLRHPPSTHRVSRWEVFLDGVKGTSLHPLLQEAMIGPWDCYFGDTPWSVYIWYRFDIYCVHIIDVYTSQF